MSNWTEYEAWCRIMLMFWKLTLFIPETYIAYLISSQYIPMAYFALLIHSFGGECMHTLKALTFRYSPLPNTYNRGVFHI